MTRLYLDKCDTVTLYINEFMGSGSIMFGERWSEHSNLWRLDILKDWIEALQEEYDEIAEEEFGE